MQNVLAALVAQLLSRALGSYKTTVMGLLAALATYAGAVSGAVPPKYAPYLTGAGIFLGAVVAALAHDSKLVVTDGASTTGGSAGPGFKLSRVFVSDQRLLGALALICLVLIGTVPMAGCNGTAVAQDIVNWTPALTAAVHTADTTGALLLPAYAPVFIAATASFDAGSAELLAQAQAYLANPSATTLQHLQIAVTTFNQTVNAALLNAARIADPASQKQALAAIGGVATIVSTIFGLVASISSKEQIKSMASATTIKVAEVREYLPQPQVEAVALRYHTTPGDFFAQQAAQGF